MPRLILMFKQRKLDVYPLYEGGSLTIGRMRDNDIVIQNLAVSGHHARVALAGRDCEVEDLQSKNGTLVNGSPVTRTSIQHGDEVAVGKHVLVADLFDEVDIDDIEQGEARQFSATDSIHNDRTLFMEAHQDRDAGEERLDDEKPAKSGSDTLVFLSGETVEVDLSGRQMVTIGRNKEADIVIRGLWALFMGAPAATIKKQSGSYLLHCHGGLIKPKRNGKRINGTVRLHHEDLLEVGPVKCRLQSHRRHDA